MLSVAHGIDEWIRLFLILTHNFHIPFATSNMNIIHDAYTITQITNLFMHESLCEVCIKASTRVWNIIHKGCHANFWVHDVCGLCCVHVSQLQYFTRASLIAFAVLWALLPFVCGASGRVDMSTSSNHKSLNESPWSLHMLWTIQHAAMTNGTLLMLMSLRFISLRHLPFNRPNAFSTTIHALERWKLNERRAGARLELYANGFISQCSVDMRIPNKTYRYICSTNSNTFTTEHFPLRSFLI